MVKNNVYYEWFASITVPNPDQVGYWVDLGADSKGRIIKVYNRDIEKWVVLFDVSKDDYVPPFIGSNGNWWVDNRDTGVKATAETPYIGENDHWFTYDPINKVYVDTGIEARGLSAYDIAVKLGFEGSEQDWIDSLSKASEDAAVAALDAANKANEAADKANQAVTDIEGIVDDAIAATDKAEEIASNPPKIVDNDWWIYNYDTKQYVNTGIAAIGDAFTYKKEYPSIEAMEADWGTADVKLGEYVLINTNNVEDPDDAKVYLKTQNGWKFIVDLSGMQGIQGWSAYEVAVQHGFVGTEEEWVQSLKQPALDAAAEALDAKAQVEATEQAVKEAEALRVTAEQGRVNAENERIAAENSRKSEEEIRKTNEANRVSAEGSRASAETLRASAEAERNTNEQKRIEEETKRISSEEGRVAAETKRVDNEDARIAAETARDTAEQERESNEATRQANEAIRETQEAAREKNTADAITAVNEAKTAAQQATTNATTAANNANTQANRAKEYADNPPKVGEDGYWYLWDEVNDVYVNTGWPSSGILLKGSLNSPEDLNDIVDPQLSDSYIVGTDLYFWNGTEWVNMGRFQGPQGEPGKDAELSKAAIEAVLVGEVTTHTHNTRYYTKDQTDANIKVVADDLANNYYNKSQADELFVKKEAGKGLSTKDYTAEDKKKVTNLGSYVSNATGATADANAVAITLEKKDPTTGTADSSAITIDKATTSKAGAMSAADKTKLDGLSNYDDSTITQDITNIKANKLETIEVTGTGNVITTATKNGTKIAFAKGITAMTQDTSDARYVKKTGDTMSGRLNIKTPASTGFTLRLAKETSDTPENDEIFVRMDIDDNNKGAFGYHNTHGTSMYNYGSSSRFHIANDGELKYLTNGVDGKVWHAGNDGTGSGLDADLLDGYHINNIQLGGWYNFVTYQYIDNVIYYNWIKLLDLSQIETGGYIEVEIDVPGDNNYPTLEKLFIKVSRFNDNKYNSISLKVNGLLDNQIEVLSKIDNNKTVWICIKSAWDGNKSRIRLVGQESININLSSLTTQTNEPEGGSEIIHGKGGIRLDLVTNTFRYYYEPNFNEEDLAYWYENNENASSNSLATGGNRNVIESLRSKFKRCIAMPSGDDAALISYCNEENSANWPDGTNITIMNNHQNRMVYFPKYYHKTIERSPGIWRTYISEQQIDGNYIEEPEMLLGSFEGAINVEGMLISTASQTSTASKTMAEFVTAAKTHGPLWGIGDYRSHATIARMFCAYYKTTNISTSNSSIPCSGGTKRYNYGKTGGTITIGNKDGKVAVIEDTGYYSTNFLGIEDCYYSKWEFVQGINILKGKYVVYDGGSFPDKDVAELEAAGATNIRVVGYEPNPAATAGYAGWIKAIAQGKYGDVVPTAHGGSETTYYSDYSWFNPTGNRIFLRSGASGEGSRCGVFVALAAHASSGSWTSVGARLAFYGKIVVVDSDTFKKMQA